MHVPIAESGHEREIAVELSSSEESGAQPLDIPQVYALFLFDNIFLFIFRLRFFLNIIIIMLYQSQFLETKAIKCSRVGPFYQADIPPMEERPIQPMLQEFKLYWNPNKINSIQTELFIDFLKNEIIK